MTVAEHDVHGTRWDPVRWEFQVDLPAAIAYVGLLGLDVGDVAGELDAYAHRALGSHLDVMASSRTVPGEQRPAARLPAPALEDVLAREWRAHWAAAGRMPDPDDHRNVLGAIVQRLDGVLAAAREPARRSVARRSAAPAETLARGAATRWFAAYSSRPAEPALLDELVKEFARDRDRVLAGARHKLRSLSRHHAELVDELLVIAAGRQAVPEVVDAAFVAVRLTRQAETLRFGDLPAVRALPYVTMPEHVRHLERVTGVDEHLDDKVWLKERAIEYARWGDARVRRVLDNGMIVATACRTARWNEPGRVTYALLRLTHKRDRASYYGIRLEDPWLGRVLAAHALDIARNLRRWSETVEAVAVGDGRATQWLVDLLREGIRAGDDDARDEAVSEAYLRIMDILRTSPLVFEATAQTARSEPADSPAEYVFQSDFERWCKAVRAGRLRTLRSEDPAADLDADDGHDAESLPAQTVDTDPVLERVATEAMEMLQAPYELHCSAPDPAECTGRCLEGALSHASGKRLRDRLQALETETHGSTAELEGRLARWSRQRARVLALVDLEQRRLDALLVRLRELPENRQTHVGRLSLWSASARECVRPRLRLRDPEHALWNAELPPLTDAMVQHRTGAPTEANVRQARLNFLTRLEAHDPELAVLYRWLRVDASRPDLSWLDERPALAAALEPYLPPQDQPGA